MARGEVQAGLDRDGLVLLLTAIGMGLSLTALDRRGAFLPMLEALGDWATGPSSANLRCDALGGRFRRPLLAFVALLSVGGAWPVVDRPRRGWW